MADAVIHKFPKYSVHRRHLHGGLNPLFMVESTPNWIINIWQSLIGWIEVGHDFFGNKVDRFSEQPLRKEAGMSDLVCRADVSWDLRQGNMLFPWMCWKKMVPEIYPSPAEALAAWVCVTQKQKKHFQFRKKKL